MLIQATAQGRVMSRKLRAPTAEPVEVRAIRPNYGVGEAYRKELQAIIAEMANSVRYWLRATWRANPPMTTMAQDAGPIVELRQTMSRLARHWTKRFDKVSDELSTRFADKSLKHTNVAMQAALRDAGFTVPFKPTVGVAQSVQAIIGENVALIKSIPSKYFAEIEQQVWQSVAAGHDLHTLTKSLESRYGVTFKRAAFIARDQNAKANAAIEATRRSELGITEAIWVHSGAGKEPRESHVHAGEIKLRYNVNEGAMIDGKRIWPGTEPNCRCTSKAVVDGWED